MVSGSRLLLHHNSHVHTFVAGTGSQGSFVAQDHGSIGTFSYEVILTATDSSGLKKSTSVNVQVARDTAAPSAPAGLTAAAFGSGQVNLDWSASSDNVGVNGYRVERCRGAGCTDFAGDPPGMTAGASVSRTMRRCSTVTPYPQPSPRGRSRMNIDRQSHRAYAPA